MPSPSYKQHHTNPEHLPFIREFKRPIILLHRISDALQPNPMQRFISFPAPQPVPLRLNTAAVGIGYLQNNYTVLLNQVEIYPPLFLRDLFARLNGIVQQISQNRAPVHILQAPSHAGLCLPLPPFSPCHS